MDRILPSRTLHGSSRWRAVLLLAKMSSGSASSARFPKEATPYCVGLATTVVRVAQDDGAPLAR